MKNEILSTGKPTINAPTPFYFCFFYLPTDWNVALRSAIIPLHHRTNVSVAGNSLSISLKTKNIYMMIVPGSQNSPTVHYKEYVIGSFRKWGNDRPDVFSLPFFLCVIFVGDLYALLHHFELTC